jgi:hypothetical protein
MLAVVGAENSWRVFSAMSSNTGVKVLLNWWSFETEGGVFLSLALAFLINVSRLSTWFSESSKPAIHHPA